MAINDWPSSERPRERLLAYGAQALSDAELLAIFLRVGTRGKNAVELARELIARFTGLGRLFAASHDEIVAVPGLGSAKYAQLQAVIEMSRRALNEEVRQGQLLDSPQAAAGYLRLTLGHLAHEVFLALWLNARNCLIACDELARGTLNQANVYPREVVKIALARNAAAVIFAHNHPSGCGEPSAADQQLTQLLQKSLALIDVSVLDHFIVAGGSPASPVSLAKRGLLIRSGNGRS